MPQLEKSFGKFLRARRERRNLTLSTVARTLGLSVVYYRDVEMGKRRPFSALRVDFEVLAELLGTKVEELLLLAASERGQLEFNFREADKEAQEIALLVACTLGKKKLGRAQLRVLARQLKAVS